MSSWVVSTIDLHDCGANGTSSSGPSSRHKHFILLVWHRLAEKCERIMKERLNEPANLSVRMGPAYDFRPSNF
ncbi:uncharacterized protein [Drosophila bipectinata]|uniref:uncharacterized protein isoform X2 n=1 Tax=Drosophila bipectinata TaxID=42026 RepID=UPI0038B384F8